MDRVIVWFSCGAASAIALQLALEKYPRESYEVVPVYCNTSLDEHPSNALFMKAVEEWLGVQVSIIASEKYKSVEDVFEARRYMSGIKGAPCTVEMKKIPRFKFERPDDIQIFGLTADEGERIQTFNGNNPDLRLDWILMDNFVTKQDCYNRLQVNHIELPVLYSLGFKNNNCIGCVKATSPAYWDNVRRQFPDVFQRRAEQSRRFGVRLTQVKGKRIFLDDLPFSDFSRYKQEDISCGPECGSQERLF